LTPAGRKLGQPPADLHVRLVHPDHEALVQVPVDLRVDGVDDGGERVAEVGAAEPAGEVDVFAALDVPDAGAFGALDDERRRRDPARDVALAGFLDALGRSALLDGHRTRDCIRRIQREPAKLATSRRSSTRPANISSRSSALRTALGWIVAVTSSARLLSIGLPRLCVTRKLLPSRLCAAVAPMRTSARGLTAAISASSH